MPPLPEASVDPAQVAALAAELGLDAQQDEELLARLLDDDFELLDPGVKARAVERLRGRPGVAVCAGCGDAALLRFRSPRCRGCGQRAGEAARGGALAALFADAAGERVAAAPWPGAAFGLAKARHLGRVIDLGEDNEDWEVRGERLRQEAAEAQRRKAEEEARRASEARKKAEEEARKKAEEEARRKAEAEARRKAEAEARKKAEEEARKKAAEEEARKEAEEAARKEAAEEEARRRAAAEAAERARREAEERARAEAEEAERRRLEEEERAARETRRPSLGAIVGARAGSIVRIDDAPAAGAPASDRSVVLLQDEVARLFVTPGGKERVNGKERTGAVELFPGDLVSVGDEVFVFDERVELENASAPSVHFARKDGRPGGPWAYFDEPAAIGAGRACRLNLVDEGVEDEHARVFTRFGRVIVEDVSGLKGGGVAVNGQRVPWAVLEAGMALRLGPPSLQEAPELGVMAGAAELKPKEKKAAAMKPSRHARTVLEVKDEQGAVKRKVFLFTRREVRFGKVGRGRDGKMLNELVLLPAPGEDADVAEKQGGLALTREGVEIRRDGGAEMLLEGQALAPGKPQVLKGGFDLIVGEDLALEGRAYRSGTLQQDKGPPQLGVKGGHPTECVRLDRLNCPHSYVFLVRMLRIGSEPAAPLRLELPGVQPGHAQVILNDGKLQVVATRQNAKVYLGDVELEPGVPTNLGVDTELTIGNAKIAFREAEDGDFTP
ncbi:MAG: cell envelope integrity protein TolA [Planctomycetes bacterium]|nr:cell envelope integrity protein TolA [Planctomycetota bacterium]